ncbi:hypothetical protein B296_00049456 [Ensete ventricosum]|uniref:Uncharacterized protein n=1 Tax=Ensete ventricosum TaxID=4639 RepID=A0A426XML0_ENSVE|nr:hypothetical protein B296_00049456 [Ensete ventricosum]
MCCHLTVKKRWENSCVCSTSVAEGEVQRLGADEGVDDGGPVERSTTTWQRLLMEEKAAGRSGKGGSRGSSQAADWPDIRSYDSSKGQRRVKKAIAEEQQGNRRWAREILSTTQL